MNCSAAAPPNLEFTTATLSIVICYLIVFILAFIGNTTMFLILFRNQWNKRRRVHSLLLHMTIAHLLVTLIYMPKEVIHQITVAWLGGDLLCRVCKFFDVFGVTLSAGILVCLSIDRFHSIIFPLYVISAKRRVSRMLAIAWAVSFLSSLPQLYIFRTAQHPCFPWYTQCVSADVIGLVSPKVTFWFSILNIAQVYFFPLLVIIVCYGSILISISLKSGAWNGKEGAPGHSHANGNGIGVVRTLSKWRLSRRSHHPPPTTKDFKGASVYSTATSTGGSGLRRTGIDSFQTAKNRTLKMTVVLVLAFLMCWTPYTIAMFIHFLRASPTHRPIPPLLSKLLYSFAVFNSALSPYLYGYFSFNLKAELRQLLRISAPCLTNGSNSSELPFSGAGAGVSMKGRSLLPSQRQKVSELSNASSVAVPTGGGGGGKSLGQHLASADSTKSTRSTPAIVATTINNTRTNSCQRVRHQPQVGPVRVHRSISSSAQKTISIDVTPSATTGGAMDAQQNGVRAGTGNARNSEVDALLTIAGEMDEEESS